MKTAWKTSRYWFFAGLSSLFTLTVSAERPELVVQTGHSYYVGTIAFSPNGMALASGGADGTIVLWDVASGRVMRTLTGHTDLVKSLTFSPDGRTLASGSTTIKLWDVVSGHELLTLAGHSDFAASVAFSPDGRTLASGSYDRSIKLWDVAKGRTVLTLTGHTGLVETVAFSPAGRVLASGSSDSTIKLWDTTSGREIRTLTGRGAVNSVAFSPDGLTLASGNSDKTVTFWEIASGRELGSLKATLGVGAVAFSPNGRILASEDECSTIELWDVASGHNLQTLPGTDCIVQSVAFSPDGRTLASGRAETIKLWDVASGRELRTLRGHLSAINTLAFSPDRRMLASGNSDETVKVWDLTKGRYLRTLTGHAGRVASIAFSPDGRTLASGSEVPRSSRAAALTIVEAIKLWDVASGSELRSLTHTASVESLAFSPDGHVLAAASQPYGSNGSMINEAIKLWDASTGREVRTLTGQKTCCSVSFSPDGRILASGGNGIILWDVASGRKLRTLTNASSVHTLGFSPDGHILASASSKSKTIELWNVATGGKLRTLAGHTNFVQCFAFSPDGRKLASGSLLRPYTPDIAKQTTIYTLKLWDVRTGGELHDLVGGDVGDVAFSPDGQIVASGNGSGTVQLWEVATGKELVNLFVLDESDWVISDLDGHFDTNNLDEMKGVAWVFPDEPFRALPPEIFMRDYYQPKLLQKLLAGERLPAVRSLSDLNRAQPIVEIVKVEPESESDFVSITVRVTGARSGAQKDGTGNLLQSGGYDLRVYRDRQLVGQWPETWEGAERSSESTASNADLESWRKLHEIKLLNGEYTHTFHHIRLPQRAGVDKVAFTAYAFNSDRVKSLTTPPLEYFPPRAAVSPLGVVARRAYLISIGVNANQSRWNLDFAVPSAQDAARLLHEKMAREYEVVEISLFSTLAPDSPRVLLQQATKANLKAVLDLLAGRTIDGALREAVDPDHRLRPAAPDDAVVLFLSSHGYADPEGTFYMVPYDTGAAPGVTEDLLTRCQAHVEDRGPACARANAFLEHTISSREFAAWWAGVDAGEMVMILDSCHSAAAPGREFRPGPLGDAGLGQLSYDKGMRILTATQPDKTARATLVQELGHSLLVQALLEEAKAHPEETLAQWLHDTEQQVPVLTHRLYPELSEADVQLPELFDFAVTERDQTRSRSADVSR